jgi:hypothetical protein
MRNKKEVGVWTSYVMHHLDSTNGKRRLTT